ncbi:MAG TPA: hypothetical protein VIS99_13890 [Terrimicrobiaceae bacterium]
MNSSERDAAYGAGVRELLVGKSSQMIQRSDGCDFALIAAALDRIALAAPLVKKRIRVDCCEAVKRDGVITREEDELIRAIVDALGCPLQAMLGSAQ